MLWLCFGFGCGKAVAQNDVAEFDLAVRAYQQKDYATATKSLQNLADKGVQSAALEYNLGNAYAQTHTLGKAILHFERAARLDPSDADIQKNLEQARAEYIGEVEPSQPAWVHAFAQRHIGSNGFAWLGIILMFVFGTGIIFWILGNTREKKRDGFIGGWVALLLAAVCFWLSFSFYQAQMHSGYAVVLVHNTAVYTAPDTESSDILQVQEGLRVEILDAIGEWTKIGLSNGEEGWVLTNTIEEI